MTDEAARVERFREIYTAQYDDLWRYCLRRTATPEAAEDVLADVFAVGWRRLDDLPSGDAARPWLFAVARNHVRNKWRQEGRSRDLHLRLVSDAVTSVEPSELRDLDAAGAVVAALHRLSESDAEVLRLAVWEELSHREIAVVMECSENAVAIRIHRARQRLAEHLTPAPPADPSLDTPDSLDPHEGDSHG